MKKRRMSAEEFFERSRVFSGFGLYAVITSDFCAGRSASRVLEEVVSAGVKLVQLRDKEGSKKSIYEDALRFREITSSSGAIFIVNDHADVAAAVGADGVHLGQDDLPPSAVRRIAPELFVGVSTHSAAEALCAAAGGADYINAGPVFATSTKENPVAPLGVYGARAVISSVGIPSTVMGGIKESNIAEAAQSGATIFAMVTEITSATDIGSKIARLASALARLKK